MDPGQTVSPKEQRDDKVGNISKSNIVLLFLYKYKIDLCEFNPLVAFTGLLKKCQRQTRRSACSETTFLLQLLLFNTTEAASVLM